MICLDTSAYSNFMRGQRRAMEVVIAARRILVPTIVLGELQFGFNLGSRREQNEATLREFLATSVVEVVPVDQLVAKQFAQILMELRRLGQPIPTNDVWIAAVGAAHGAPVVTYDAHFRNIDRVGSIILSTEG